MARWFVYSEFSVLGSAAVVVAIVAIVVKCCPTLVVSIDANKQEARPNYTFVLAGRSKSLLNRAACQMCLRAVGKRNCFVS